MSAQDEEGFFVDALTEYQWARDSAGLAPSTIDQLIKPVIEVCDFYGTVPWHLTPCEIDKYFAGPGKRAHNTHRQQLNHIDAFFAFLEQRYTHEITMRFGAMVESPVDPFNRPAHRGDFGLRIPPSQTATKEFFGRWRKQLPHARKYAAACRDYVMTKIAYVSGVRAAELCPVTIGDIHWEHGQWGRFVVQGKVPGQEGLFELRRDWSPVVELSRLDLPTLTDSAERLLADLDSVMQREMWSKFAATKTRRTLAVLVSWLGADAPLLESDIRTLADNRSQKFSGRRVTQFLENRGLLVPDAEFRQDSQQKRLEAELSALPATIAQELSVWIKAVRGEGKWEHTGRTYRNIARYWHVLDPILKGWLANGIESLREITQDDIKRAIATRKGTPARSIHIVLRNVFRALR
ncbi:hypothetical protein ACIRP2_37775 [Streptomyces sp. NPDC101194]|uniref:hypothetical protein n=1 Tax=Streptomyces sp. NPDC101194 TaxID=3366127 RepID=UPI00382D9CF5